MKTVISIILAASLFACGQSGAGKTENRTAPSGKVIKPGATATSSAGYTMTATINGIAWEASSMMPPDAAGRIVGYYDNHYIGLPYSKAGMVAGEKTMINEDNAIDLNLEAGCLYTNQKGAIEITKADAHAAEGKFSFTAICGSTKKEVKVTDGFFRIVFSKN